MTAYFAVSTTIVASSAKVASASSFVNTWARLQTATQQITLQQQHTNTQNIMQKLEQHLAQTNSSPSTIS